jgi:hypothetical protein
MTLLHQLKTTKPFPGGLPFIHGSYEITIDYNLIDEKVTIQQAQVTPDDSRNSYPLDAHMHDRLINYYRDDLVRNAARELQRVTNQLREQSA